MVGVFLNCGMKHTLFYMWSNSIYQKRSDKAPPLSWLIWDKAGNSLFFVSKETHRLKNRRSDSPSDQTNNFLWVSTATGEKSGKLELCCFNLLTLHTLNLHSETKWLPDQRRISAVRSVRTSLEILLFCHVATASVKTVWRAGGDRNKHVSVQFVREDLQRKNHLVTWC